VRPFRPLLVVAALLAAGSAEAHPAMHAAGFAEGFAHPFGGLDHVLAMVAVGAWAAQLGGRALWVVPSAFLASLCIGAALAASGSGLPWAELGIAASLLGLGAVVALRLRPGVACAIVLVSLFALAHGHAHGSEVAPGASLLAYGGGFVLATALLHLAGAGAGLALGRSLWLRAGGAAIAAAGVLLILG